MMPETHVMNRSNISECFSLFSISSVQAHHDGKFSSDIQRIQFILFLKPDGQQNSNPQDQVVIIWTKLLQHWSMWIAILFFLLLQSSKKLLTISEFLWRFILFYRPHKLKSEATTFACRYSQDVFEKIFDELVFMKSIYKANFMLPNNLLQEIMSKGKNLSFLDLWIPKNAK